MIKIPITIDMVNNTVKLLDRSTKKIRIRWRGPWQYRIAKHICDNEQSIVQGVRQASGKTWVVAMIAITYLLLGGTVIIGMPTMQQSRAIVFRRISQYMRLLEKLFPVDLKRLKDTEGEVIWANNANLVALSTGEQTTAKEGYTADLIIIDEAHRRDRSLLAFFSPQLLVAKREGTGKLVLLGVGGHKNSLIEEVKEDLSADETFKDIGAFAATKVHMDEIVEYDPSWQIVFDKERRIQRPHLFDVHFLLKPELGDARYLFPNILKQIDKPDAPIRYYFGIDIGYVQDYTYCVCLEKCGVTVNMIDSLCFTKMDFFAQAKAIYNFIDKYTYRTQDIAVELNGMGVGLHNILNEKYFGNCTGIFMTQKLKEQTIFHIQQGVRENKFAIYNNEDRREVAGLTYRVKPMTGICEFEHSDLMSGIIMGFCAMNEAYAI